MGRLFSLRGKLSIFDNAVTANHPVFDYVSPDRTRAWKVLSAYIWPVDIRLDPTAADGFLCLQASLATDTGKFNHPELNDPSENRTFACAQQTYNHRDAPTDFITPNGVPLGSMWFLVDPDRMVTKDLYINAGTTTDVDTALEREWGYMIILEEQKISPAQSLFQQIKGIGQDILS